VVESHEPGLPTAAPPKLGEADRRHAEQRVAGQRDDRVGSASRHWAASSVPRAGPPNRRRPYARMPRGSSESGPPGLNGVISSRH